MFFTLQPPVIQINVSRIANLQYFEFSDAFHSMQDRHNFCELLYVDKGSLSIFAENYSGILGENQVLIHRPNELHSLAADHAVAPNVIIIGFECDSESLSPFARQPITLSSDQTRALSRIMQEGMRIYEPPYNVPNTGYMPKRAEYPFGADQLIKIGLEAFLISLVRSFHSVISEAGAEGNIQSVHQYITENYRTKITLANLCFLFGMNKTTLCRDFKATYDTTILDYINTLRIREAKSCLRQGKLSITEISDILGFSSVHYFCRLFKQQTGRSPTQYIKNVQSK
ncbi:MAG: AraC family transcriptional regulator [Ruminococcaceae bacterium]|nr:AraC family transcriptional regulator [Oscillospiraceae bacterium]